MIRDTRLLCYSYGCPEVWAHQTKCLREHIGIQLKSVKIKSVEKALQESNPLSMRGSERYLMAVQLDPFLKLQWLQARVAVCILIWTTWLGGPDDHDAYGVGKATGNPVGVLPAATVPAVDAILKLLKHMAAQPVLTIPTFA